MRPYAPWRHVTAIIVEQAVVLLVPAFAIWWGLLKLHCPHTIAAFVALIGGLVCWAVIWSAADLDDANH